MKRAVRVTFVISTFVAGGAQRVMSIMANHWARKGWEVTVLTFSAATELPFYDLHPSVRYCPLGLAGESPNLRMSLLNNANRVRSLRGAIRMSEPDAIISFIDQTNVLTLLATIGFGIPTIVSERTDPNVHPLAKGWKLLRRLSYFRTTRLVALSLTSLNYFDRAVRSRGVVIPNPVVLPDGEKQNEGTAGARLGRRVLAMGQLTHVKGFDRLLHAFAAVAPNHSDWSLEIWGDGPLRADLELLGDALGLRGRFRLPGVTKQSYATMQQGDLFVLSSRYEGFPNVLCEAMACGSPVISFDCPSGPREIIRDGVDGILVPDGDVNALAAAMDRLMGNASARDQLAARAPEVLDRFSVEEVMSKWEDLLREIVP